MDFKNYIDNFLGKLDFLRDLYDKDLQEFSYDRLSSETKVDHELLYFKNKDEEVKGVFLFGFDFFTKGLSEQQFKDKISYDTMNFKILRAYTELKKKQEKVKVSEILTYIQDEKKDSLEVHMILQRILTLSYYLNWKLERDNQDIEEDFVIEASSSYIVKLRKRFDFSMLTKVFENDDLIVFLNSKARLSVIFKHLDTFTKKDVEKLIEPAFKEIFSLNSVEFK